MDSTTLKKSAAAAGIGAALCLCTGIGSASAEPTPHETSTWVVENGVPHRVQPGTDGATSPSSDLDSRRWQAQGDHYNAKDAPPASKPVVDDPARLADWVFPALGTTAAVALAAGAVTTIQRRQQRPA